MRRMSDSEYRRMEVRSGLAVGWLASFSFAGMAAQMLGVG